MYDNVNYDVTKLHFVLMLHVFNECQNKCTNILEEKCNEI